ncbi:MAG: flagellar export protein FliJ [Candidatus Wallbacteria bacterium]|nr:flagellar export protein FliJ [Candidatus Wallbacteria bacterium]
MNKFKFKPDNILKLRQAKSDEIKTEMARLLSQKATLILKIESLNSLVFSSLSDLKKVDRMTISDIRDRQERLLSLKGAKEAAELELQNLELQIGNVRTKFMQAMRDLKIMENLRDKKLREFEKSRGRTEQKTLDEQGTQRFLRND